MNNMTRCLVLALLVSSFSLVVFGAEVAQKKATGVDPEKWGHNAVVTSVLTADQSFADLYSNTLTLTEVVAKWVANFKPESLPPGVNHGKVTNIVKALDDLSSIVRPESAEFDQEIAQWTPYRIHTATWKDLPGKTNKKAAVRNAFDALQRAGIMCLTFMNRKEEDHVTPETLQGLTIITNFPNLISLSNEALYTTSSERYSRWEIDTLAYLMDDIKLIRSEQPEARQNGVKAVGCCIRTSRICNPSLPGSCTMCNSACCLGSVWCP